MPQLTRRRFSSLAAAAIAAPALAPLASLGHVAAADDKPDEIHVDYAYYNPSSLALKKFGWLEEDLAADGVNVTWTLSAGSNKANEYLRSDAVDFGSTAGAAALLARANGSAIQTVYIYSKPEWTALVVAKDSNVTTIEELKGKKIAATRGTDPYFFLLRALEQAGMTGKDVNIVNLQHADGKTALEHGDVDAWAGLDPYMAQTEIEAGSKLIYRNIDFNSYGFLNAREQFIGKYPGYVPRVLAAYEKARLWILQHQDDAARVIADAAGLSLEIARRELIERTKLDIDVVPGAAQTAVLENIIPIFTAENQLQPGADAQKALDTLYAPQFAQQVAQPAGSPVTTP